MALHLEITSTALLVMSLFLYGLAVRMGNRHDARRAKRTVLLFGALSLALAFPVGVLGWRDLCLVTGLVLCAAAVRVREDMELMMVYVGLGAVAFGLWVLLYPMTSAEYGFGFGLAVLDAALLAVILRMDRPKKVPAPEAGASTLAF